LYNTYRNNGSGYSWWNYQDDEDYFGVLRWSGSYTADPIPDPTLTKPIDTVFQNFSPPQNQTNSIQPANYYDPYMHADYAYRVPNINPLDPTPQILTGYVTDTYGNPIKDAYIEAWEVLYQDYNSGNYIPTTTYTFSKDDGSFKIIPYDYDSRLPNWNVVGTIFVSAPGCSRGSTGLAFVSSTGITNATVPLDAPSGLLYDATFHNINVSWNQYKVFEAWNDVTVDGGHVDPMDIDCIIRARNDVNIESEFHSESGSETWIYTTNTQFVPCSDLGGYDSKKERAIASVNQEPITDIKQIQLNFMSDTNQLNINIYPNPSSGIFTIESSQKDNFESFSIDVFDLFSKLIYTTIFNCKRKKLDLSEFDAGMYYVQISKLNYHKMEKIIIIK